MYSSFIARQPISDRHGVTVAYELLYRKSHVNKYPIDVDGEHATKSILADLLIESSGEMLNYGKSFINFPHTTLIAGLPLCLPAQDVVIEVLEADVPSPELINALKILHKRGYQIALDDFMPTSEWEPVLSYISIIKIDIQQLSLSDSQAFIQAHQHLNIQFLAEKIENHAQYQQALSAGFHLFQGYFLGQPEMLEKHINDESYPQLYLELYQHLSHMTMNPPKGMTHAKQDALV
ncbi:EAL and HDOD domain-containing protein [Vibrio rarus]|uniref:EAL and HDOD domain-containing protein n=1 Tax=Vibrio rarus TaxID=413403 RepID=UPI0021C2B2D6|nr:EAL domain-containing protein [Vibrio rarus]